mgnify:CR=1 FL=1
MAFQDVEEAVAKYWNPENIGDNVEGNVMEFKKDNWDKTQIVLDLGDDENGEVMTTTLPGHAHLQRFVPKLEIGDYIRVELIKQIPPTEDQLRQNPKRSPTNIYKVQKDPERAINYE